MSDSGELKAGALVTPSIRLEKMLGRGGMGSVWLAEHLQLRTQVVVKFMTAEHAENVEAQQRFRREAELAAQAKSPHVVQIFDHGISQLGVPYIAMELLEGEDLGKRIGREGTLDAKLFSTWLLQACRGLSRAHAKNIVHRDIKPENIFLCENDGEILVKVLDFGVAKGVMGPSGFVSTRTGAMLGTAYYMSPEQTMGKKDIDHRSDLWSLAVVAFYALTGTRPFVGDGIGPLVLSITTEPLPLPSARNPALTPEIDAWMMKALARKREERFQSAKELAEAFMLAVDPTSSASARQASASWPSARVTPSPSDGAIATTPLLGGLAASTMSPSVSTGGTPKIALPRANAPQSRGWLLAVGVGAALGLLGVVALLASRTPVPNPAPHALSPALPLPAKPSEGAEPALIASTVAAPTSAPSAPPTGTTARKAVTPVASARLVSPATKPAAAAPLAQPASLEPTKPATPKPTPANPLDMKIE